MTARSTAGRRRSQRVRPRRRTTYHHGNLAAALIDATLHVIEEQGVERVSVREAAKRAAVSPGAPFRHFPDRKALLTAVAEQAVQRLREETYAALGTVAGAPPLVRFRALGTAYLRWVARNPTHFQVISARRLIDFEGSEILRRDTEELRELMGTLLREADARGDLRSADWSYGPLLARALAYGLARMFIEGHFAQWGVARGKPARDMQKALDLLVELLTAREMRDDRPRRAAARVDVPRGSRRATVR